MENIIELVNSYVNNGDDIVVAVSGGVDSMVLLYSLVLNLQVVHKLIC